MSLKSGFSKILSHEGVRVDRQRPDEVDPLLDGQLSGETVVVRPWIAGLHPDHAGRQMGTVHLLIVDDFIWTGGDPYS
jgi:hypothetical protein